MYYRNAAAEEYDKWIKSDELYGFCSERATAIFNWLRIEFPDEQRWSVRFVPVSGWEIRQNIQEGDLWVLDSTINDPQLVIDSKLSIRFSGYKVERRPGYLQDADAPAPGREGREQRLGR